MARVALTIAAAVLLFLAGFATGRFVGGGDVAAGEGVDPSAAAVQPGSEADPIRAGAEAALGGWSLVVDGFDPDATRAVLASNQFNVPPGEERTYVTVEVLITRRAPGPGILSGSVAPALVTPAGGQYPLDGSCGVVSRAVDAQRLLATNDSLRGLWCWELPVVEVEKVRLRVSGTGGGAVWFELP